HGNSRTLAHAQPGAWPAGGCVSLAPQGPTPPSAPGGITAEPPPSAPAPEAMPDEREFAIPTAVRDLVVRAGESSGAGKHEQAAAFLERALRIAPHNAVLWQNLAVVRYRQGQYAQAENLALKSISLAGDNINLKQQDWALVGVARQLQGDEVGARQARTRAADSASIRARP
ncbi:MAG: tetratricopeptide repeat protein, partial [Nitrococcus sp.]|nr:tetratricopeptide repeat protein [Nitrococcus sp.]